MRRDSWTWKDAALIAFAVVMPGGVSLLAVWLYVRRWSGKEVKP